MKNKIPIAEIEYDKVNFVFVSDHWDVHIKGLCIYKDKLCEFHTDMNTVYDYDEDDSGSTDIMCHILSLSWWEKLKWKKRKFLFEMCVGKHWTYPQRKNKTGFYYRKPEWLYKKLFKLYYKLK